MKKYRVVGKVVGKGCKYFPEFRCLFWWFALPEISLIENYVNCDTTIEIRITKDGTKNGYKTKDEAVEAIREIVAIRKPKKIEYVHVVSGKSKHERIDYAVLKDTYVCIDKRACKERKSLYKGQRFFQTKLWDENGDTFRNKVMDAFESNSVDYYSEKQFI